MSLGYLAAELLKMENMDQITGPLHKIGSRERLKRASAEVLELAQSEGLSQNALMEVAQKNGLSQDEYSTMLTGLKESGAIENAAKNRAAMARRIEGEGVRTPMSIRDAILEAQGIGKAGTAAHVFEPGYGGTEPQYDINIPGLGSVQAKHLQGMANLINATKPRKTGVDEQMGLALREGDITLRDYLNIVHGKDKKIPPIHPWADDKGQGVSYMTEEGPVVERFDNVGTKPQSKAKAFDPDEQKDKEAIKRVNAEIKEINKILIKGTYTGKDEFGNKKELPLTPSMQARYKAELQKREQILRQLGEESGTMEPELGVGSYGNPDPLGLRPR